MPDLTVPMREIAINGRWPLLLPEHRAARPEWPFWEKERLASMHDHIGPGDVVYDIGAEEGDLPALWATWGAKVVLVEPNPKVWANIRAVWEGNNLPAPHGWLAGFAAADDADPLDAIAPWPGVDAYDAHLPPEAAWPECAYGPVIGDHGFLNLCERPDVVRRRIDTLADVFGPPTAITIDVEGAELAVLQGAAGVLDHVRPKVWVSIHPEFSVDMYGVTAEDCLTFMADHGYDCTHLATDHEVHYACFPRERSA